jgi:hypothetical protein
MVSVDAREDRRAYRKSYFVLDSPVIHIRLKS